MDRTRCYDKTTSTVSSEFRESARLRAGLRPTLRAVYTNFDKTELAFQLREPWGDLKKMGSCRPKIDLIRTMRRHLLECFERAVADSSSGRTPDSGSGSAGSNPASAAKNESADAKVQFTHTAVARSSSGPGRSPLKAKTGVRLPYGLPTKVGALSFVGWGWGWKLGVLR